MSDTAVICYVAGARFGSYDWDLFEACYAVWYGKVEWRHFNTSGECWAKEWQACACRPIAWVSADVPRVPLPGCRTRTLTSCAQAICTVLHDMPKDQHLIVKVKDQEVVTHINGRVGEITQTGWTAPRRRGGEELLRDIRELVSGRAENVPTHHECEIFMGMIVSGIEERRSAGVTVDILCADPSEEQDRTGVNTAQE